MNMVAPRQTKLVIEVIFDFVCPWCYLGVHRLSQLRARRPDLAIQPVWRPFLLNPDMPRIGMSRVDYALRKFGGEERARRLYAAISEIGAADGLVFDFAQITRTPSSVDAHRLLRFAMSVAGGVTTERLVLAIFRGYFREGLDIGRRDMLTHLAAGVGLDVELTRNFLAHDAVTEDVHADNLQAHRLGINGVPFFVIEQNNAIAGAQEPEVLERLCDLAASGLMVDHWAS